MPRSARTSGGVLQAIVGIVIAIAPVGPAALAQAPAATPSAPAVAGAAWLAKANETTTATPGTESANALLFGALSALEPSPAGAGSVDAASLLGPKSPEWAKASAWAEGAAQVKALEALTAVTDTKKKFLITLPYGTAGVDAAWVKAGIVVDLPKDSMVAGARYRYLGALERLIALASVDATRLAVSGKPDKALTRCVEWLRLAKLVAERESAVERVWAMKQMILATERMRDLAYSFRDIMTPEVCRNASDDLDERLVQVRRLRLPSIERFAAEQLIEATIDEKAAVNPSRFAAAMARLQAGERALSSFGAAAWYRELAGGHAGWFDTKDQLAKVFGGWNNRWQVENLHDNLLQIPSDYAKMDKAKFALIDAAARNIEQMQALRMELLTAMAGTRVSLGVVGYERKEKRWPPNVSAIAPNYVRVLDADPYGYDKRYKNLNPFFYKVPIRDDPKREREEPRPHEMTVTLGSGGPAVASSSAVVGIGAPELELFDAINGQATLAAHRGKVVLVDFWATWCGPCIASIPTVNRFLDDYSKNGLVVIGVCDDDGGSDMSKVVADKGIKYITAIDRSGSAQRAYGVRLWPSAFVVDRKGVLRTLRTHPAEAEAEIVKMLNEQPEGGAVAAPPAPTGETTAESSPSEEAAAKTDGFSVTVTDKDFLLWSVGPDGVDGQAKLVGSGGSDVLMWPPLLSLRRAHAGN